MHTAQKCSTRCSTKRKCVFILVSAVVLTTVVLLLILVVGKMMKTVRLTDASSGVSVRYVNKVPDGITAAANLKSIAEADLFSQYDTFIFLGEVLKVRNIEIKFGNMKEYRAIAEIKVHKIYRGEELVGDIIKVLLPVAIGENIWVEDNDIIAKIEEGMTGIFMPYKYDESSVYKANKSILALKDVAEYGFPDGSRYAFLKGKDGLIFSRQDYPTISGATTLNEIEEYIISMVK